VRNEISFVIMKTTLMKYLGEWFQVTCERVVAWGIIFMTCVCAPGWKAPRLKEIGQVSGLVASATCHMGSVLTN
jgi:hypothetical protein